MQLANGNYQLTGTRNGKPFSKKVYVTVQQGQDLAWVINAEGKSLLGTTTGYYRENSGSNPGAISSYRGQVLLADPKFEKL